MTIIGLVVRSGLAYRFSRPHLNGYNWRKCWVKIAEQDAVSEMWLVWSKHHEQSHAVQRFKEQLITASRGRYFL